ncbi:beta-catenin-like protein 1 isoform X2 [Artemia franciscana]|uniref:Beta-catenin-like protein 1 n=1 Tax=Artemia franciscana TaxID=6661 RepID=A0AA88I188_ARTSF|nr:hypothetical protein QYM36_005519 [Artemia franciscana]
MDVSELLRLKDTKKRESRDSDGYYHEQTAKVQRVMQREDVSRRSLVNDDDDDTKTVQQDNIDENAVKKIIFNFEKRSLKNQELRIKYPELPEKFMDSELELHEGIQQLHVLATVPLLYPLAVNLNLVQSLMGLLTHDNTDISVAVVNLLQELTDLDTVEESQEGADVLIDALKQQQVVALLVQNLERLDETVPEESEGVHNSLAVVENLAEMRPEMCLEAAQQGLIQWLLKRLKAKMPFDSNKLYVSEILSILLHAIPGNRAILGENGGIDILLQQLAHFKRQDPKNSEEQEMMENLFDSLCYCLLLPENRERFLLGEGVQLMNLMLREKKLSRNGALKVLNHAVTGPEGHDSAVKLLDILGLRTIFPLFMKTPKKSKLKGLLAEEFEEHVLSIIANIFRHCQGPQRQRLLAKFAENDFEKVERLMELHFKYTEKVSKSDREIQDAEDEDEEATYLRRLDNGLFVLQMIDYIILEVAVSGPSQIRDRVLHILNLRGGSVQQIREIIREYVSNFGEDKNATSEKQRFLDLLGRF